MKHILIALALLPTAALAHDFSAGSLTINHPWTRATPTGSTAAAGYATITNKGTKADVLTAATVEGAGHTMLHSTVTRDGVAHMNHLENGITLAPGETVTLQPGGTHIMMMKLAKPFKAGELVKGTLTFREAGTVNVEYKVEAAGAKAPATAESYDHHAHH
ncbi:MAG: hypothetical protein DI585_00310 [Pseudomonas fluorescens]|nr:MAG: hypothetical protein DI585_00310 [Pseudomonas fluorescens]